MLKFPLFPHAYLTSYVIRAVVLWKWNGK